MRGIYSIMKVLYNNLEIKNGMFITPKETRLEPKIEYYAKPNSLYTLIMHDPDAVGGNLIHWIIVNIDGNNLHTGYELLKYKGPSPPPGSGRHKYIFLFFKQNSRIRINNVIYKRHISMVELYEKLDLILKPIYAIYFTSKNQYGGKKEQPLIKQNKTKTHKKIKKRPKRQNTMRRNM